MFFLAFPRFSPIMPAESEGCLVVPAVFNTVVGRLPVQGGFDSYPLRHHPPSITSFILRGVFPAPFALHAQDGVSEVIL